MSSATPPRSGEHAAPPPPPPDGAPVIPGYRIVGRIGRGGMGVVYRAEQELLGRAVAIKALLTRDDEAGVDQGAIDRLIDEGRIVARMEPHPNIAQVYDLVRDNAGNHQLVMEFVNGATLESRLKSDERFAIGEAVGVAREAAKALQHAHEHGIVHRDVKPSNIMLTSRGAVKVMDFGIARSQELERRTQTGLSLGTPHYMSPEQIRAVENLDARADVYSLAVVLYYAVCGCLPFDAPNAISLIYQQMSEPPPPPSSVCPEIPPRLEAIILKGMEKDREKRYQSAEAFEKDLSDFASKTDTKVLSAADFRASGMAWARSHESGSRPAPVPTPVSPFRGVDPSISGEQTSLVDSSAHIRAEANQTLPPETGSAAQYAPTMGMPSSESERPTIAAPSRTGPAPSPATRATPPPPPALDESADDGDVEPDRGSWTPPGTFAPASGAHLDDLFAEAFSAPEQPAPPPKQATPPPPPRLSTGPVARPRVDSGAFPAPAPARQAEAPRIEEAPRPRPAQREEAEEEAVKPMVFQSVFTEAALANQPKKEEPKRKEESTGALLALALLAVLVGLGYWGWTQLGLGALFGGGGSSATVGAAPTPALPEAGARLGEAIKFGPLPSLEPKPAYGPLFSIDLPETAGAARRVAFAAGAANGGDAIVAGCEDGTLRLWDAYTGESIRSIPAHAGRVTALDVSPEGALALTGGADKAMRLWNLSNGREERKYEHLFPLVDVAFSPSGELAAATCEDGLARLWHVASGDRAGDLEGHQGPVVGAAFMGRGDQLATAGADATIRAWDVATRRATTLLGGGGAPILALAGAPPGFGRDGGIVFATSGADKSIRLWDVRSGATLAKIDVASPALGLALSPSGERLASAHEDGSVALWNAETGAKVVELGRHRGPARAVAFSPGGGRVASVGDDRVVALWRAEEPGMVERLEAVGSPFESAAFLGAGDLVAFSGRDGSLRVWNAATGRSEKSFEKQAAPVRRMAALPDGVGLAAVGGDAALQILRTETRDANSSIPSVEWDLTCVAVAPDGRFLAVGDANGDVFALDTSRVGEPIVRAPSHSLSVWAVAWSPDGKLIASSGADGKLFLSNAKSGAAIATVDHTLDGGALCLDYSPDGRLLASGSHQGLVRVWDGATGDELRRMGVAGDPKVNGVAFFPDGRRVAAASGGVGSTGEPMRIWDVATGDEIAAYRGHRGQALAIDVSPDGAWVFSCGQGVGRGGRLIGEAILWRAPAPASAITP